ncbi:MAG: hypothetical protein SGJ19_25100 [Planctomycetia bacterium]|nr:hypothetical protein [Planctomycetia bacterium]
MSHVDEARFPLWSLFAFVFSSALSLGVWNWMDRRVDCLERVSNIDVLVTVVAASPLVFCLVPRRWLQFPRALFFLWLPWPSTAMMIGLRDFIDDRKGTPINALFLAIVSFVTIFTPTIIVGMRRSRVVSIAPTGATDNSQGCKPLENVADE